MARKLKTQTIFNRIISAGYYAKESGQTEAGHWGSPYMCNAARNAASDGIIRERDQAQVRAEIDEYLQNVLPTMHGDCDPTLMRCLAAYSFPSNWKDCLAVYKDWKNRPIPNQEV